MSGIIREARLRHVLGLREFARLSCVAASTVVDWERSDAAETIHVRTLRRALAALGEKLTIATKLIEDPQRVLDIARAKIGPQRSQVRGAAVSWLDRWEQLIESRQLGQIIEVMLGTEQPDLDMRSVSPFMGLLSRPERCHALRRATDS